MTDYVKSTNFTSKDSLATGNPLKIVKGSEFDTEFNAIATAVATKADLASPTLTGTPLAPTAATGTNTAQLATTAFVKNTVDAYDAALTVATSQIEDSAVTNAKIADATIASAKLANSGVTASTYGSATAIPVLVVNAQGQVTSASTASRGVTVGAGSVTNGGTFDIVLGSSGKALVTVQGYIVATVGGFGTGTIAISIGGSSVATQAGKTIEYDSRTSGTNPVIQYLHSGTANSTVTVTFNFSGSGSFQNATYSYIGI